MADRTNALVATIVAGVVLAGCSTVPEDRGFDQVRADVEQHLDQPVHWYRGEPEDEQAVEAMRALLDEPLTADTAVQIALLNNRRLQATYQELGIAQAQLVQAGLLRNPVFDAAVLFPASGGAAKLELGVAQEFLSVLYIPMRRQIADAELDAATAAVTQAVLDLAGRTRSAFYHVQAQQQLLEMHEQIVLSTEASYEAAQRLHHAGNITDLTLDLERAFHEQTRLDLAAAEASLLESRERLNALMGLWGHETTWELPPRLPDVPEAELDLAQLERRAIEQSLTLAGMRQHIVALGRQLGVTDATALVPELQLGAEAERESGRWKLGPSVQLPIPLFDQGQARRATAEAQLRQTQERYAAQAVELRAAVRAARHRKLAARRQALYHRDILLPLHQRITQESLRQFNAMELGLFDLLRVRKQQAEAGGRYIQALRDYWLARTDLELIFSGGAPSTFDHGDGAGRSRDPF